MNYEETTRINVCLHKTANIAESSELKMRKLQRQSTRASKAEKMDQKLQRRESGIFGAA